MNVINKVMASAFGIGGTKIDTILGCNTLSPGDTVSGICKITGGSVEQSINNIQLEFKTNFQMEDNNRKVMKEEIIQKISIPVKTVIVPEEKTEREFTFTLSENCPIATNKYPIWIDTNLDIALAVDGKDKDYVNVIPSEKMKKVLDTIEGLGLKLKSIENEHNRLCANGLSFSQEFEFMPMSGDFQNRVSKVIANLNIEGDGLGLSISVDKKDGNMDMLCTDAIGFNENKISLKLSKDDLDNEEIIKNNIKEIIDKYIG